MVNIFGPLLTGAGSSTIFNTTRDVSAATLSKQMQSGVLGRANEQAKKITAEYDAKIQSNDFEKERWERHKKLVDEAADVINNTFTRLEGILSTLDQMLNTVNGSEIAQNDPDNTFIPDGYAAAFDSQLKSIYASANETRVGTNLLSSDTKDLDYPVTFSGHLSKIFGADIRPDYSVTDTDGKHWQVELDTKLLRRYDSYPDEATDPGVVATFTNPDSLVLNSFSNDTINFTIQADTANAQTFDGTIERDGIEVLNAWLYENFTTADGLARAREDIAAAKETIFLEKSRYELVKTTLNYHSDVATAEIRNLRDQSIALQTEGQKKVATMQDKVIREYQAAQSILAQKFSQKASLQALLPRNQIANPVLRVLMDLTV